MNEKYVHVLSEFVNSTSSDKYFIVGSFALLSYTQANDYDREIHDIDIVMETREALKTAEHFKQLGYTQNTFINPRMPFYAKLMRFAESKYLRFSKDSVDVEILATSIEKCGDLEVFEMYPGIKVGLPKDVFTKSSYSSVEFRTVSKEMLFFFKKFANNTFGKKVKYKEDQRYKDVDALESLVSKGILKQISEDCRLFFFGIPFKIPQFLLN